MLRKNLAHFWDSHSFDWNVSFPLLLAFLTRVNDKNVVDLEGIINIIKTPIEEFNDKIYRHIS